MKKALILSLLSVTLLNATPAQDDIKTHCEKSLVLMLATIKEDPNLITLFSNSISLIQDKRGGSREDAINALYNYLLISCQERLKNSLEG